MCQKTFQSTRPIRGATILGRWLNGIIPISIHAPHTGRDATGDIRQTVRTIFQSTRPIRGATTALPVAALYGDISIHAPHTGRDDGLFPQHGPHSISIHAPHTGRDDRSGMGRYQPHAFQSTRPIRGATSSQSCPASEACISIHAPHTGRDKCHSHYHLPKIKFQSTRPIRGATSTRRSKGLKLRNFNPRAPYGARP